MNWVPPVAHVYACSLFFTHCAAHCVYGKADMTATSINWQILNGEVALLLCEGMLNRKPLVSVAVLTRWMLGTPKRNYCFPPFHLLKRCKSYFILQSGFCNVLRSNKMCRWNENLNKAKWVHSQFYVKCSFMNCVFAQRPCCLFHLLFCLASLPASCKRSADSVHAHLDATTMPGFTKNKQTKQHCGSELQQNQAWAIHSSKWIKTWLNGQ